jgi:hypothetical protein
MIYELCNIGHEQNDTFYRLSIIKKSSLAAFNHLTADATVLQIITDLSASSDAINLDLLPENLSHNASTITNDNGKEYSVSSSFVLTPLDKNLQTLLELYNNEEVVYLLKTHSSTFVYGTTLSPLVFTYNELHSNQAQGLKGYTVNLRGRCLGTSKQFEFTEFDIFDRGLAFELAGSL